jgi:hypothetical protein
MFETVSSCIETVTEFSDLQSRCLGLLESLLSPVIKMPGASEPQPNYRDIFRNITPPVVDDANALESFIDMFASTDEFGFYNME